MGFARLFGVKKDYDWGGNSFIANLLDEKSPAKIAEYWMGVHPSGMSVLEVEQQKIELQQYIHQNPTKILGEKCSTTFQEELPFLFKILDVRSMLSIQVHPTLEEAKKGFDRENKESIPLNASYRNFKDPNHKPEIMVALSDFWLLHGFRSLNAFRIQCKNTPELKPLLHYAAKNDFSKLLKYIFAISQTEVNAILEPLHKRLKKQKKIEKGLHDFWALRAFEQYTTSEGNYDRGVLVLYALNLVNVKKGEAVFQAAGIPHAYLEGQNVELMSNSDNVFRGGLTPKHIDPQLLLKHTLCHTIRPKILKGKMKSRYWRQFPSEVPDFEVHSIALPPHRKTTLKTDSASICIVLEGEGEIYIEPRKYKSIRKGDAYFIDATQEFVVRTNEKAIQLFRAIVP